MLESVAESYETDVYTKCTLAATTIQLELDIRPRVDVGGATFQIMLDDTVVATVTIPALGSPRQISFIPEAGIEVGTGVSSNIDVIQTGGPLPIALRPEPVLAGNGYCSDVRYLPEGGYPPRLDMGSPMYNADPVAECMNRCLNAVGAMDSSSFRAIRDRAFYVNAAGACGCSAGGCETQRGADEQNPYRSFRITVAAGGGGPPGGGGGGGGGH